MENAKSELPPIGKVSPEIFNEIILPQLGRKRSSVLVGPRHGVDIGVCDLGHNQVMVTTTDPVFIVPPYGWERSAWFAVHILASDAVTSGLPPTYMTIDLNLPMSITRNELETMWGVIHRESEKMGMAIVSGHTGRYEGCEYPMVGGATVICIGPADKYVTPAMARVGDKIIVTKGAAVEAAGLFACTFPDRVAKAYDEKTAREAEEVFWQMSVVDDALTAVEVGVHDEGVTAMHDATECGVWGGLFEVAEASEVGMVVHKEDIILQPVIAKVCSLFEINPYSSISEGTLIATVRPGKAHEVEKRLNDRGILTSIVGEVVPEEEGMHVFIEGKKTVLEHPRVDPFWQAFGKAAEMR